MAPLKLKWGIEINKEFEGSWRFGIMLIHFDEETYFTISLFKCILHIGKFYQEDTSVFEGPVIYVIDKTEGE